MCIRDRDGYDLAARYLPSAATQQARQQALPQAAAMQSMLQAVVADSPFNHDAFNPFLLDVETCLLYTSRCV